MKINREPRDIFTSGLEAVEIPTIVIPDPLTRTATNLYQVMLLNYNRDTGTLFKAKVADYTRWLQCDKSATYAALDELNEKGYIQTRTKAWVRGRILKTAPKRNPDQPELELEKGLSRALVHREALRIMIEEQISPTGIKTYWALATQIDLKTGKIHERQIDELAELLSVKPPAIYKAIRDLNKAGLVQLVVDFGIEGHMPFVALAFHAINLLTEAKESEKKGLRGWKKMAHVYRRKLYKAFGIPVDALDPIDLKRTIADLKSLLNSNDEPSLAHALTPKPAPRKKASEENERDRAPDGDEIPFLGPDSDELPFGSVIA